ncbi:MAG: hypothetical protein AAF449_05150, partial [Myxococcota bacterium]
MFDAANDALFGSSNIVERAYRANTKKMVLVRFVLLARLMTSSIGAHRADKATAFIPPEEVEEEGRQYDKQWKRTTVLRRLDGLQVDGYR